MHPKSKLYKLIWCADKYHIKVTIQIKNFLSATSEKHQIVLSSHEASMWRIISIQLLYRMLNIKMSVFTCNVVIEKNHHYRTLNMQKLLKTQLHLSHMVLFSILKFCYWVSWPLSLGMVLKDDYSYTLMKHVSNLLSY